MAMTSTTLNRRVRIETHGSGRDGAGQPVTAWVEVCTVWASVLHQTGIAMIRADQGASLRRVSVRIRKRAGILPGMHVVDGTERYAITQLLPQGSDFIDLVCEG